MRRLTLEERISRLEMIIMKNMSKNEFLDIFDKPKRSDEKEWVSKLFSKYPSLNRMLSVSTDVDNSRDSLFNITLNAKNKNNNGVHFVISTEGDRGDMQCTAFDGNNKVASLPHFHLDKELNQCAKFILQTMHDMLPVSNENRHSKFENVPLTALDCESFEQIIKDSLDDLPEIEIDITDDNSDHGFINVGIYNQKYITEYDIIVNSVKSVDVEHDGKKICTAKSFEDAAEKLAEHFMDDYMSGKYKNK